MTAPQLQEDLSARRWRAANETTRLLIAPYVYPMSAGLGSSPLVDGLPFGPPMILQYDRLVREIDLGWVGASNGRFGFSVQARLWTAQEPAEDLTRSMRELAETLGWRWNIWPDIEGYGPPAGRVTLPVEVDTAPEGMLPFHDVISSGAWWSEFSPRDGWGEYFWPLWAHTFQLFL